MALGKKSKPDGYFELGDLLYVKTAFQNDTLTYAQPDPESGSFKILDPTGLIGVINDEDSNTTASGTWLGVKNGPSTMIYVELDSSRLYSKANPEYNYPEAATNTGSGKSGGGFNWSGLLEGITAVSSLILSKITNKNATTGTDTGIGNNVDPSQTTSPVMEWIKKNILLVLLLPLVIVLIVILIWKPKKKAEAAYQAGVPPTLNPTKL